MEEKEFIRWNSNMSVGIHEIDEQHKQLIQLINDLYEVIVYHPTENAEQVKRIMNELVQYTIIHFAVEESLFRIFDYPDYDEHKQKHTELKKQVAVINRKVQSSEEKVTLELMTFLRQWLRQHIMVEDKQYGPFFVQHGIAQTHHRANWAQKIWAAIT